MRVSIFLVSIASVSVLAAPTPSPFFGGFFKALAPEENTPENPENASGVEVFVEEAAEFVLNVPLAIEKNGAVSVLVDGYKDVFGTVKDVIAKVKNGTSIMDALAGNADLGDIASAGWSLNTGKPMEALEKLLAARLEKPDVKDATEKVSLTSTALADPLELLTEASSFFKQFDQVKLTQALTNAMELDLKGMKQKALVTKNAGFAVISGVMNTLADRKLSNLFDASDLDGAVAFYNELKNLADSSFHYVANSHQAIIGTTVKTVLQKFPLGTTKFKSGLDILNKLESKVGYIKQLMAAMDQKKIVLIGDDDKDISVFAEIIKAMPTRVKCVYIRAEDKIEDATAKAEKILGSNFPGLKIFKEFTEITGAQTRIASGQC